METVAKDQAGSSAETSEAAAADRLPRQAVDRSATAVTRTANPATGLTVRDVLAVPTFAGARVLAGEAGLDRVVQRLNVMEVPDILPWVKPDELLLTTGYPVRHNPAALADLVADLDERGLAAIAVKLHRYLDALPPGMLAEADRRGFPVIEFPDHVGFDDVLNQVFTELLNRQAAVLARSEEVHRALVSVVLAGGGLDDLAAELARILDGPVLITSPDGRIVARAGAQLADIAGSGYFDGAGRFRVEAFGQTDPGSGPRAGRRKAEPARPHLDASVVPILVGRVDHGRIVAFSAAPLTEADVHGLERAATVAALAITKRLAVAAVESKYRADFLRDVLTGRVPDVPAAISYARSFGWDLDRPLVAVVAELDPGASAAPTGPELRPVRERFVSAWQAVARLRDPDAAVVSFTDEVVLLLGVPKDGDVDRLVADLRRRAKQDSGLSGVSFSVGVSRVASGPDQLPAGYEQARNAVRIGRRLHGNGASASFDRLGVHRLISLIPDTAELRGFVTDVLGELAGDTPECADLRHTLDVLLDTNCTVAQAARRLHFHYNTMRYRIQKLERLLGPFTTDAALRLDLALALRVMEMRGL